MIELVFIEKLELAKYYFKKTQLQIFFFNNIKNTKSETNLAKNQFQAQIYFQKIKFHNMFQYQIYLLVIFLNFELSFHFQIRWFIYTN